MATNRKLRTALLEKLKVSPQRLQQLTAARRKELPMSVELATYTIAHEKGIDIAKYLSTDEVAEVRSVMSQLQSASKPAAAKPSGTRRAAAPKTVVVSIAGINAERLPGMTAAHAKEAKAMAEKVYPAIYVLENSARDVIRFILKQEYGADWWEKGVPKKQREKADSRKADEAKDPWHGKRGADLLDYLDINDLPAIVAAEWKLFKPIFPGPHWFSVLISDLNVSRRVTAHMNPLEADDVKQVEAAFRKWSKQLNAKADLLK